MGCVYEDVGMLRCYNWIDYWSEVVDIGESFNIEDDVVESFFFVCSSFFWCLDDCILILCFSKWKIDWLVVGGECLLMGWSVEKRSCILWWGLNCLFLKMRDLGVGLLVYILLYVCVK